MKVIRGFAWLGVMSLASESGPDDDDIDLSVLDDDDDDQIIRRWKQPERPAPAAADPDPDFEQFLRRTRERHEAQVRIEAMLDRSRQAHDAAQNEIERVRGEIAREAKQDDRAEAFHLDQDSEFAWAGTPTALRRPALRTAELSSLLAAPPGRLADLLLQAVDANALCARHRVPDAVGDLIKFLWHLVATDPDPFVVHRAALLLLATACDSDREPSTLVTLDQTDLPLGGSSVGRGRRPHQLCIKAAKFIEAFIAHGSRNVLDSDPVTSLSSSASATCDELPANIGPLLMLLAGCIDLDPGQYAAQAGALLPYLAAFLIDPQSVEFADRILQCLYRLMEAAAAHSVTVSAAVKILLDDRVCRNLPNKVRILSALPPTRFGTAVAKQAALDLIRQQLLVDDDPAKLHQRTPIEHLVVIADKAALHERCEQGAVQRDLAALIRLQHLVVFRRPMAQNGALAVSDVEKASLKAMMHSWELIKDSLPTQVLNKTLSTARDALVAGLRIAEHIVARSVQICL